TVSLDAALDTSFQKPPTSSQRDGVPECVQTTTSYFQFSDDHNVTNDCLQSCAERVSADRADMLHVHFVQYESSVRNMLYYSGSGNRRVCEIFLLLDEMFTPPINITAFRVVHIDAKADGVMDDDVRAENYSLNYTVKSFQSGDAREHGVLEVFLLSPTRGISQHGVCQIFYSRMFVRYFTAGCL
ncbi:hypothetical protein BaRGS_00032514, partial [Batillaria attramentaria]